MDRHQIVKELKSERDRLDDAIRALQGGQASRRSPQRAVGRPRKSGGITAAGRKRLSQMMKKRWAARRRATQAKAA